MVMTDVADPAATLGMVPVPVAAKKAAASITGSANSATTTASANECLIRPALTRRARTRLVERNMLGLLLPNRLGAVNTPLSLGGEVYDLSDSSGISLADSVKCMA